MERDQIFKLMTAGNARLIFHNVESGNHRTYKIKRAASGWYWVSLNYNTIASFKLISDSSSYLKGNLTNHPDWDKDEYAAFMWILYHVFYNRLPDEMVVYHTGICCVCARELTDPESIKIGIGPTCRNK